MKYSNIDFNTGDIILFEDKTHNKSWLDYLSVFSILLLIWKIEPIVQNPAEYIFMRSAWSEMP